MAFNIILKIYHKAYCPLLLKREIHITRDISRIEKDYWTQREELTRELSAVVKLDRNHNIRGLL